MYYLPGKPSSYLSKARTTMKKFIMIAAGALLMQYAQAQVTIDR